MHRTEKKTKDQIKSSLSPCAPVSVLQDLFILGSHTQLAIVVHCSGNELNKVCIL